MDLFHLQVINVMGLNACFAFLDEFYQISIPGYSILSGLNIIHFFSITQHGSSVELTIDPIKLVASQES